VYGVCCGRLTSCLSPTLIYPIKCFATTSDNLSRAINQTIERIEKSHLRGEECAIAAEIDKSTFSSPSAAEGVVKTKENTGVVRIPRVFPMSNEVTCVGIKRDQPPKGKSRHFHPASDDPRQYTLLKFYELNAGAVKLLLDGRENDLPFVPGPKEHEIIHYRSDPQRSILLSGRSGTGKTTCLVFRMWAQHTAYKNGLNGSRPRQLFLTKNDMLCREVKRSFNNMGLAWAKRHDPNSINRAEVETDGESSKFFTASEWFDALDASLPGQTFFTKYELQQRVNGRKYNNSVTEEIEAWFSEENVFDGKLANREVGSTNQRSCRREMTFTVFRKLWRKIRSHSGSKIDCTIAFREIKSFIKGSVSALHINREGRSLPQNRFLSLEEYLGLRKFLRLL
jgi:hypothetical protein